jgi:hypothetical protein
MPSPFPGMDPYLECSTWLNFHSQLCAEMARQLTPKVRPRYLARLTERFVTLTPEDPDSNQASMFPDVSVVKSIAPDTGFPQFSVEILDRHERKLVTAIEVLSPSNK